MCEICKLYHCTPSQQVVWFPQAENFNEKVAMNLKKWGNRWILHLVDMWSRVTASVFINRKRSRDVIENIMLHWFRAGFGIMKSILTDNGGEFSTDEMREVCSILNVQISAAAANSSLQNGLCKRIHAVTDTMLLKLREQCPKTPTEVLLSSANVSRNSLQMWHGLSSSQLGFCCNPNLPNVMSDKLPAFTGSTASETLEKHLNAVHAARKSFIETESNERIRPTLRHKVRSCETVFNHRGSVFYKCEGQEHWLGPAKLVFHDNKVIYLRYGMFIYCSPNQLLKTSDNALNTFQPTTRGEEFNHPNTVKLPNQKAITSMGKLPNQSTITSNQLAVTFPCAHKIISGKKPTDLPDNPLPPANHIHTNETPNNQLDDDHSDELSNNQLTHNQQPEMTAKCNNMLPNDISNHESQLISNVPQPVTTTNHM